MSYLSGRTAAVLFDRDNTLIADVPYNGDPDLVFAMPTARATLDYLRALDVPIGVVSNQSGIARGLITHKQVRAVNKRVEELLGPFDVWRICPHDASSGCRCRKPRPGMILSAAQELGVPPHRVAMIGDIGADIDAAEAAGALGVLVPTPVTRATECTAAKHVAASLWAAVALAVPTVLEVTPR